MIKKKKALILGFVLAMSSLVIVGCNPKDKQSNPNSSPENAKTNEENGNNPTRPGGENREGPPNNRAGSPEQEGRSQMNLSDEEKAALENKDYNAWLEAAPEDSPLRQIIVDEETFLKYVEMQEAMESGDMDKVKELREELGFPGRPERN